MRFFVLVLTLGVLTQTAAAQPINSVVAVQQALIEKLKAKVAAQEIQINRLNEFMPRVLVSKSQGNCEYDFGGDIVSVHSQIKVTVGIFNVQPSSAVYILNRQDAGPLGFLQLSNNAPGNNNGNIFVIGSKIFAMVGGVGASCTITMQRVF